MKIENDDWLYFFSIVDMSSFYNRETMMESIREDIINGILVFSKRIFASAKMVNKKSGQVIDLLN